MKKIFTLLLCLFLLMLPVLTSCDASTDPAHDPADNTLAASDTEAVGEAFNEGMIVGQSEGYSAIPGDREPESGEACIAKYEVHFWYDLDPKYTYRDASITVTVHLTFHNEDGTVVGDQRAAYTLHYDENGQLTGEEPVTDEDGDKVLSREIVLEEVYQTCDFMSTNVDFELTCSGMVFAK